MGLSFTKWESKLQNEILIYKTGFLDYKWDSRVAIHRCMANFDSTTLQNDMYLLNINKNILTFNY
jgi:hypothetical protein